jgi:hypothetical protein
VILIISILHLLILWCTLSLIVTNCNTFEWFMIMSLRKNGTKPLVMRVYGPNSDQPLVEYHEISPGDRAEQILWIFSRSEVVTFKSGRRFLKFLN